MFPTGRSQQGPRTSPPVDLVHRSSEVAQRSAAAIKWVTAVAWRSGQAVHTRSVLAYRVRNAPRDLVRLAWFVLRGHAHWMHKVWTFFTYGDLRGDVRAARLVGDAEARRAAQETIRADLRARWARFAMFVERTGKGAAAAGMAVLVL